MRALFALIVAVLAFVVPARGFDLNRFWDLTCGSCHGHSADFARKFLSVKDGALQGRHHVDDLRTFMSNHYLAPGLVDPVYDMLLSQRQTGPLFRAKCAGCHKTAAELVRQSIELREGMLFGRETERPVAEYLQRHGKLTPAEQAAMVGVLGRIEREVRLPW